MNLQRDTIAALSTPAAPAGLGVLRISGDDAIAVADRVFRAVSGKPLAALGGWLILHQTLTPTELTGCALMFAAIVASQLPSKNRGETAAQE